MPASYAHYRFGREVTGCLPFVYRKTIESHQDLYNIGLHGPDILFYYHPISSNEINQTGYALHDKPASEFFGQAAALYMHAADPDALKAYLFGFVCHFSLDSVCHPYIEKIGQESGLSHAEIETELERFFMEKDGLNPAEYIPVQHIHPDPGISQVIAPCFDPATPEQIRSCLKGMIFFHKLLHAPERTDQKVDKRRLLYLGLKLIKKYDSMQGLIMKPEPVCDYTKYMNLLHNLYTEAVTVASSLIQNYANVLDHASALSSRFSLTFGKGENWESLFI